MKSPEVGRTLWSARRTATNCGQVFNLRRIVQSGLPLWTRRPDLRNAGGRGWQAAARRFVRAFWLLLGLLVGQAVPPPPRLRALAQPSGVSRKNQLDQWGRPRFLWPVGMATAAKPNKIAPLWGRQSASGTRFQRVQPPVGRLAFSTLPNADDEKRSSAATEPWNSPVQLFLGQCH